jgi:hypothetical protein
MPEEYAAFVASVRSLAITDLALHAPPFASVAVYAAMNEPVPAAFPRPHEHFVIADHMIDLPVLAIDASPASEHYGRLLAYSSGDYWTVADSMQEFITALQDASEAAFFGRHQKT